MPPNVWPKHPMVGDAHKSPIRRQSADMSKHVIARPWTVISSKMSFADRWLRVRTDDVRNGRGEILHDYHVLEYPDWISIVAVQDDGRLLLAREYRHGVGQVVLGLISGVVEPTDEGHASDGAEVAARRELLEETGHTAKTFSKVLSCYANPASHNNRVTTFVACGLEEVAEPSFDLGEEVELVAMDPDQLFRAIGDGTITMQAMHIAGLYAAAQAGLIVP